VLHGVAAATTHADDLDHRFLAVLIHDFEMHIASLRLSETFA
jgi:hypothetical protein